MLNLINTISYFFYRVFNKLCTKCNIAIRYYSKTGIKGINKLNFGNKNIDKLHLGYELCVEASKLFLGPDSLKDKYTLLGTPICESPQLELMKVLDNGDDLYCTNYAMRIKRGSLDGRVPMPFGSKQIKTHTTKFMQMKTKVLSDSYEPVIIYSLNDRLYIKDGKHRAALCCLLDKPVKCILITNPFSNSVFTKWTGTMMYKKKEEYSKALKFISDCEEAARKKV